MANVLTHLSNGELISGLGLPKGIDDELKEAEGTEYEAKMNEFLTPLVNKIVYQKVEKMESFENPFKKFDSFPIDYGDTIENIFVELPDGYTFDKNDTDPFKKYIPSVKPLYASINLEMVYPITIQDKLMKRACVNNYGFESLANNIVATLKDRMNLDEYSATLSMLSNEDIYAKGIEEFDTSKYSTDEEKYKAIVDKIIDVVSDFAIPCKDNNKLGVLQTTAKENCLLIIKKDILRHINLDYLAGVYNLSKVDLIKNIIEVRDFHTLTFTTDPADTTRAGEDIDFIVLDSKGFDNHISLKTGGTIYNPKGLYTNHFSHLWKIIAYKLSHNARAFKLTDSPIPKNKYDLERSVEPEGSGDISVKRAGVEVVDGEEALTEGDRVVITATAEEGYTLEAIEANGEEIESGDSVLVSADLSIVATFTAE